MQPAVDTVFDVAAWFMDRALNDNEYLQPQKMHRLLFLAQGYFGVAYAGRLLMPAIFIAEEMGPTEPNIYRVFALGRPSCELNTRFPTAIENFLDGVWRRFGPYSANKLNQIILSNDAYVAAIAKGSKSIIDNEELFASLTKGRKNEETPEIDQVIRERVLKSQTGKPVSVKPWIPSRAKPGQKTVNPPGAQKKRAAAKPQAEVDPKTAALQEFLKRRQQR